MMMKTPSSVALGLLWLCIHGIVLHIPMAMVNAQLEELKNATIIGWYKNCSESESLCTDPDDLLDEPVYLDFDTCYANPNLGDRSVSFLGHDDNVRPVIFTLIFYSDVAVSQFAPTDCDANGACSCSAPTELDGLRLAILEDNSLCTGVSGLYHCTVASFDTENQQTTNTECFVTAAERITTPSQGDSLLVCGMVARLGTKNESATNTDNIEIPSPAQEAYCTAILGWYDGCSANKDDKTASLCQSATYHELDEPVFIDLDTCFVNPYLDGRTVSFFGQLPSGTDIIEYHLIFHTATGDSILKPTDCNANGTCTCPQELLDLKAQFLQNDLGGQCQNTKDYSCFSEVFFGATEECMTPGTEVVGNGETGEIYCSMVAKVKQFEPCATRVDIPLSAYDTNCTAITGWYNQCGNSDPPCEGSNWTTLEEPVFLSLDACYVNPYMDAGSVSFWGRKDASSPVLQFHIIFADDGAAETYMPINCDSVTGVCNCTDTLHNLKTVFLNQGSCDLTAEYTCKSEPFTGFGGDDTGRCFVPAARVVTDTEFSCAMVASLESFFPCNTGNLGNQQPSASDPTLVDPLSVVIPDDAHEAYCTAIVGWHQGCKETPDGDDYVACNEDVRSLKSDPLFIDFNTCYINPYIGDAAVSMYGKDADGVVKGFHLIFLLSENFAVKYRPMANCTQDGACVCSEALEKLRSQFLEAGTCTVTADYLCTAEDFQGYHNDDCLIPTFFKVPSTGDFVCNLAAQVQQFGPCNFTSPTASPSLSLLPTRDSSQPVNPLPTPVSKIPASAVDLGYTAITGWWDGCNAAVLDDACADANNRKFEHPVYLDLDTCYCNPNPAFRSVSFFVKRQAAIESYHFLFENSAAWATYKPTDCNDQGECSCPSSPQLQFIRKLIQSNGTDSCQSVEGSYKCFEVPFSTYNIDCYVPVHTQFGSGENSCAMAARLEQIVPTGEFTTDPGGEAEESPGEAEFPDAGQGGSVASSTATESSKSMDWEWWSVLLVIIAIVVGFSLFSVMVVTLHRRRRRRMTGDGLGGDDDEVWVRSDANRDSRFTRRPLNTSEHAGDGVWKKDNIHDLKFTMS